MTGLLRPSARQSRVRSNSCHQVVLRIYKRLPRIDGVTTSESDYANLAYAGEIGVGGLKVNCDKVYVRPSGFDEMYYGNRTLGRWKNTIQLSRCDRLY
jgi:hypothetical protein